jgi:cytochrome P450
VLGEGLLTSEGDVWKQQRRMMQPMFSQQQFERYGQNVTDLTLARLETWRANAQSGQPLDVHQEMTGLTMAIVAKTLLGLDFTHQTRELTDAITTAIDHVNDMTQTILPLPSWLPTPGNLRFQQAMQVLRQLVGGLIRERRQAGTASNDLLTLLVRATDEESGQGMSDEVLQDQVMTMFLAGHETTAQSLSWIFYLLSKHPDVQRRVCAESAEVVAGRTPTVKDLGRLEYGKMVVQESMRLYPPVWAMTRQTVADDEVGGYHIPAGADVVLSQWVMHRHPAYWDNPEGFDPERFSAERSAGRSHGVYFPFGGGPRVCIGSTFAMMEIQLIVPAVLQAYRLDLVPGQPVVPKPSITLRPQHGVQMRVHPRHTAAG